MDVRISWMKQLCEWRAQEGGLEKRPRSSDQALRPPRKFVADGQLHSGTLQRADID